MIGAAGSLKSSPTRRSFVLTQVQPRFEVLAISGDRARLETERDALLAMPWDQDAEGVRELLISPAIHLSAATHDRRRPQRRDRFR